jgi:hypothetical protein
MLPILILMDNLTKETRKTLPYGKSRASILCVALPDDGFPGWHLECTAMSTKYLGNHFDIHGGGMDLKFHHECEVHKNEACTGQTPVNYGCMQTC